MSSKPSVDAIWQALKADNLPRRPAPAPTATIVSAAGAQAHAPSQRPGHQQGGSSSGSGSSQRPEDGSKATSQVGPGGGSNGSATTAAVKPEAQQQQPALELTEEEHAHRLQKLAEAFKSTSAGARRQALVEAKVCASRRVCCMRCCHWLRARHPACVHACVHVDASTQRSAPSHAGTSAWPN